MPKPSTDPDPEIPDLSDEVEEAFPSLDETTLDEASGRRARRSGTGVVLKIAIAAAVVLAVGAALLAYRSQHRRTVVSSGLARVDALLRLDTDAGYREAATLLEPLAAMDPAEAGSVRAFALAMRFADYRAAALEEEAEGLLVGPGRAEVVPAYAHLAAAALALGRREVGNAATAAARAGDGPWASALQARIALAAGNPGAALDPAAASAASGSFAPGLAVHGDALRRLGKDLAGARAAYEAALSASPAHPRAAYGLAKLALSGQAPSDEAAQALERILDPRSATPAPERGRAALHLASLRLRAGDGAGARAALEAAELDGPVRGWAERAAAAAAANRGPYRAVSGAPDALVSASDDDLGELSATPPAAASKAPKAASKHAAKAAKAKPKATAKKPPVRKTPAAKAPAKKVAKKKAARAR